MTIIYEVSVWKQSATGKGSLLTARSTHTFELEAQIVADLLCIITAAPRTVEIRTIDIDRLTATVRRIC